MCPMYDTTTNAFGCLIATNKQGLFHDMLKITTHELRIAIRDGSDALLYYLLYAIVIVYCCSKK